MSKRTMRVSAMCAAAGGAIGLCGLASASPLEPSLIPADPAVLIHIDLEALRNSAVGQHVLANKSSFNLEGLDGLKVFGIDVTRDLMGVTVVMSSRKQDESVVIVRTTSAVDALWAHLKTEPHAAMLTVDGHEMLSWQDGDDKKYGVVRGADGTQTRTVYIADEWENIAGALKAADGKAPSLAAEKALAGGDAAILVDMRRVPSDMRKDVPARTLFGSMSTGRLEVHERDGKTVVRAVMNYDSPETAQEMREVGLGLLAFGRMAARSEPELRALSTALSGAKVEAAEKSVTISGSWTGEQAIEMLKLVADADAPKKNKPQDPAKAQ